MKQNLDDNFLNERGYIKHYDDYCPFTNLEVLSNIYFQANQIQFDSKD